MTLHMTGIKAYPAMPQKEQQITPELVSWLVDLRPGQVQDIGGDVTTQHIQEELKNSMYLGNYLGKEVCYIGSSWPGGGTSSQSTGERIILGEHASELAQQLCLLHELIIFDLGSGYTIDLYSLLNGHMMTLEKGL